MPTKSTTLTCIALMICSVVGSVVRAESDSFALRARRILPVSAGLPRVIENGVLVVREGRIVALGADVKVPPDLRVIEVPNGVVVPGFIAAASDMGGSHRGDESVAAGYRAVDSYDRYANHDRALAAGVTAALRAAGSGARIHAVEPEGAACLARSLALGSRTAITDPHSVADGLLPLIVGERNWEILGAKSESVVESVTVPEAMIVASLRYLVKELGLGVEPSGAVAPAPLLAGDTSAHHGTHVAIVSGGNVAPERLAKILAGG